MIFGMFGLEKVEYLGDMNGTWKGPETCIMYEFGRDSRIHWVDVRDLGHLLTVKDTTNEALFQVAEKVTA